jgi:hypothetical protein
MIEQAANVLLFRVKAARRQDERRYLGCEGAIDDTGIRVVRDAE